MELPVRLCAAGCGRRVPKGRRCPACSRARSARRATASDRGYGAAWRRFRLAWQDGLVALGIVPVCGAALPDGPPQGDSRCQALGLMAFSSRDGSQLHLDHEPPLQDAERDDPAKVCDPLRVQLLCAECHARKDDPGRGRQEAVA